MDYLRSCYETEFLVDEGDATRRVRGKWYFVPRDRAYFPYVTPFRSLVWERDGVQPTLGEDLELHPWYRGDDPSGATGGGPCGTPDQWYRGLVGGETPAPLDPSTGLPVCCGAGPVVFAGGAANGGAELAVDTNFILQEDGAMILQETDDGLELE